MVIEDKVKMKEFIFGKYNNVCCNCGSDKDLHMHHILHQCDFPEFSDETDNIMLLCKKCHRKYHNENQPKSTKVKTNTEKIEMTCAQGFKDKAKEYADRKGISLAAYVKSALFEQMKKDEKKG